MIDFGYGISLGPLDSYHQEKIRAWRNDERVWKWCRQYDVIDDRSQEAWFKRQSEDSSIKMWAVMNGDDMVGVAGLTSIDWVNRRAEFSLYIDPQVHRKGFGAMALRTLLRHGFYNLGLNSIWGETFQDNPAVHMFERVGLKKEGTRRDFYFRAGRFIDCYLYSMLRSEFDALLPAGAKGCPVTGTATSGYIAYNPCGFTTRTGDLRPFAR